MKNRKHFYVSNKNVLTWLIVLCMIGSAVTRIVFVGMKGADNTLNVWSQIVLPIVAAVLFALITLISGKEQFYKTAIPIWLICLYYWFVFSGFHFGTFHIMILVLYAIALVFIAVMYTLITCGKLFAAWLLPPLMAFPLAAQLYIQRRILLSRNWEMLLPDVLMIFGCVMIVFALQVHTDGLYHPTWGDRPDGRRVRSLPPMTQITPYFMPARQNASNLLYDHVEITHVERYIREKRRQGFSNFGIMHVLLACYCRSVAKYPGVNRFLSGQRVYARGNDIQFCMTIKKEMDTESPDSCIKVHLTPSDTAEDVYNKLSAEIEKAKGESLDSDFDNTAGWFSLIPGVLLKFVIWLLKLMDYFGLLPGFLLEVSPFHGSVFFTSMGSLGIPPVYHHLYDFGNLPVFCAFGMKRRAMELQEDGSIVQKKYVDIKMTTDERIVDGFYYATFFKYFKRLLRNPEQLDTAPEKVAQDID